MGKPHPDFAVNYASGKTPAGYRCDVCKKGGIKLWRSTQAHQTGELFCLTDAAARAKVDISKARSDGSIYKKELGRFSHQFGVFAPAVLREEDGNFCPVGNIPPKAWTWWLNLPLR